MSGGRVPGRLCGRRRRVSLLVQPRPLRASPQSRPLPQLYGPSPLRRRTPSGSSAASSASTSSWFCSSCPRRWRPHPGCMIRLQSSMSNHIPQFCGVLGHTFMEFLKGSGDYCQAQHDLYADK
ncbi:uncharacterized LOC128125822 homolog [Grus americana]|uniref:uncharacterized LOC128125822 homolog n=1 Tax=Grus americana TaxID=9117 RepID=UPI00240889CB|nr:uncharacterized LOC128125822 homolog [Grus americana]